MLRRVLAVAAVIALTFSTASALVEKPQQPGKSPDVTYRYPVVTAPLLKTAPVIDGVVDKAEWSGAAQTLPFVDLQEGRIAGDVAVCWLAYTRDGLYAAFKFARPSYAGEPKSEGKPDAVWGDDSLELFLRPKFGDRSEYNFVINAKGVRAEGLRTGATNRGWNADWTGAARLTDEGIEGEVMIPFASLQTPVPEPGVVWEFLAVNSRRTPTTELGASSFLKHWTAHEDFGYLVFGDASTPAVRPLSAASISPQQVGLLLEIISPANATVKVSTHLYRPKADGANYYRIVEAEANPLGPQVEARDREFVPAAKVMSETLKRYDLVKAWDSTETLAAERTLRLPMAQDVPAGDYLLHYRVTAADGQILAGGALPFRQTPAFVVEIEPYLLVARHLAVTADYRRVGNVPAEAQVVVELVDPAGKKVIESNRAPVDLKARRNILNLSTADRLGRSYDVRARIIAGDKTVAEQVQAGYNLPAAPEWWGNNLGKIEAIGEVPKPWTPVVWKGNDLRVWGRAVTMTASLLPAQIVHNEVPMTGSPKQPTAMLAAPVQLDIQAGGPVKFGPPEIVSDKPWLASRRAKVEAAGLTGTLTVEVEFDGLMKYTLDLAPGAAPATLDRLAFVLTLPKANATHYNHGYVGTRLDKTVRYEAGVVAPEGLTRGFTEKLWLGNPTLGVDFVCERDQFWSPLDNPKAVQVTVGPDTVVARIDMVAEPRAVKAHLRYQWAILPTPAKPMNEELNHRLFLAQSGASFDLKTGTMNEEEARAYLKRLVEGGANAFNMWAFGAGSPPEGDSSLWNNDFASPSYNPATAKNDVRAKLMKDYVRIAHEQGMRWVTLYMLWGAPSNWPNQQGVFWREMMKHPLVPSFGGYLFEPGPAFNDWYLWEVDRSIRELDIDGMYQDSSPHREITANVHTGTGWYDEKGLLRGSYPVFANREFHKRVWVLFHQQRKKDGLVYSHNSHFIAPVVESFCDVHHCGEGSALRDPRILVGKFYGYPCGIPVTFTRWNNPIYPEQRMHSWRTALMLDIDLKAHPSMILPDRFAKNNQGRERLFKGYAADSEVVANLWDLWRIYPWAGSVWMAPWDVGGLVTTNHPDLMASLHLNKGKAAQLVVSNFSDNDIDAAVTVDLKAMGFDPAAVKITDVITPKDSPKLEGGQLKMKVLSWRWRMALIEPAK